MFGYLQSSQVAVPLWLAIVGPLFTLIAGIAGSWLNRKRKSSVRAEDRKSEAEATRLEVASLADIYGQLRDARNEVAAIVRANTEESRELKAHHESEEVFLRSQIEIRTQSEFEAKENEKKVRDRFHAANGEIQRCILRIRDYEEILRAANPAIMFTPFDFKPYEEIMRAHKER